LTVFWGFLGVYSFDTIENVSKDLDFWRLPEFIFIFFKTS
jgi:hypothetical protein